MNSLTPASGSGHVCGSYPPPLTPCAVTIEDCGGRGKKSGGDAGSMAVPAFVERLQITMPRDIHGSGRNLSGMARGNLLENGRSRSASLDYIKEKHQSITKMGNRHKNHLVADFLISGCPGSAPCKHGSCSEASSASGQLCC